MPRQTKLLQVLLCGTIAILCAAGLARAANVKVFLLGGQSNMRGQGGRRDLSSVLQSPQDDVLFYFGSSLTTLRPGSGSDFGPEISFGRTLADAFQDATFALIKYAAGGTNLENDWDPDTGNTYSLFRDAVANGLKELENAGHSTEIVGMLWTQGERDVVIGATARYEENLNAFIGDVRTRYGESLPFFVSQLSIAQTNLIDRASEARLNEVRQAQATVAATDPHTYLIVTDTFSLKPDNLHFNAAGQIALGEAFAHAYVQSIPEPTSLIHLLLGLWGLMTHRQLRIECRGGSES